MAKIFMDNSTSLRIDINAKDNLGKTACHLAFQLGHVIVANMIIDNSAT
jgi:ankyrin repeat protein